MEQATNLIGRGRGGGGGGGRGGHWGRGGGRGGHWGHGGPGRRRFFGGGWGGDYGWYGYGYPYFPAYGAPEYEYSEEEVEVSGADETPSYLRAPGGSLVSREGDDLRLASHVLRFPSRGLSFDLNLGPDLVLRASICVDGRCHQGQLDLSSFIRDIHARLHGVDVTDVVGRHHRRRRRHHRHDRYYGPEDRVEDDVDPGMPPYGLGMPPYSYQPGILQPAPVMAPPVVVPPVAVSPLVAPQETAATTKPPGRASHGELTDQHDEKSQAVKAAGEALVDQLYDQHCGMVCGSWLSSIGDAFTSAHHAVASTIKKFKEPITVAAVAVASAYGGPQGGVLAAKIVPSVIDATTATGEKKKKAQATLAAAQQAAQTSPSIAQALSTAQQATATTAAAYHVAETAAAFLRGDPAAQQRLELLRQEADANPKSREALTDVVSAIRALSAADDSQGQPGATTIGGAHVAAARQSDLRAKAQQLAVCAQRDAGVAVVGVGLETDGTPCVMTFQDPREAQDWVDEVGPGCLYAAYYDASDITTWPRPVDEVVDPTPGVSRTISQGWFAPFLLGLAGGAAIDRWAISPRRARDRHVQAAADEVVAHKVREAIAERDHAWRDAVQRGTVPPGAEPPPAASTSSGAIWPWALGLGAAAGLAWWMWPRHKPAAGAASPPAQVTSSGIATIHQLRDFAVQAAAHPFQIRPDAQAIVVAISRQHGTFTIPYEVLDQAVHFVHHVNPRGLTYVAAVVVEPGGDLLVVADRELDHAQLPQHDPSPIGDQVSGTMTSSELASARAEAVSMAQEAYARCAEAGAPCRFFGTVRDLDWVEHRPGHGSIAHQGTTTLLPFHDEDAMRAWYCQVTADPTSYTYVALFDSNHRVWPGPALSHAPPGHQVVG